MRTTKTITSNKTIAPRTAQSPTTATARKRFRASFLRIIMALATALFTVGLLFGSYRPVAAEQLAGNSSRVLPIDGSVVNAFNPPPEPWQAGHRGVDLAGSPGSPIVAAADGTVSFVGTIAGVTSVSITHADGLRTTYQPVDPSIAKGDAVKAGQQIGTLVAGHCPDGCLHWGLLRGDTYLNPIQWLSDNSTGTIRLLPDGTTVKQRMPNDITGLAAAGLALLSGGTGNATMPADGPITSPFEARINPITGKSEFHDGLDIGASCGSPVRAAWSGTVRYAAVMSGFGNRVEIKHDGQEGAPDASSYNHMADSGVGMVSVGQHVEAGQVIGVVGTTGLSTGCHLHFSVYRGATAVDPRPFLP